jgi:lipopolysaccharide export system protein LptC
MQNVCVKFLFVMAAQRRYRFYIQGVIEINGIILITSYWLHVLVEKIQTIVLNSNEATYYKYKLVSSTNLDCRFLI